MPKPTDVPRVPRILVLGEAQRVKANSFRLGWEGSVFRAFTNINYMWSYTVVQKGTTKRESYRTLFSKDYRSPVMPIGAANKKIEISAILMHFQGFFFFCVAALRKKSNVAF